MGIISTICKNNGIRLCKLSDQIREAMQDDSELGRDDTAQGWAVASGDEKYIFVDFTGDHWRDFFTGFHELAHHFLGHLTPQGIGRQGNEQQADVFAAVFTALAIWDKYRHSASFEEGF